MILSDSLNYSLLLGGTAETLITASGLVGNEHIFADKVASHYLHCLRKEEGRGGGHRCQP